MSDSDTAGPSTHALATTARWETKRGPKLGWVDEANWHCGSKDISELFEELCCHPIQPVG